MKIPKFNIVSGVLAAFVVIALFVATTPGGFGVTRYDRTEALSAAAVFFLFMCAVLWFTGRKSKRNVAKDAARKGPPDIRPPADRGMYP